MLISFDMELYTEVFQQNEIAYFYIWTKIIIEQKLVNHLRGQENKAIIGV